MILKNTKTKKAKPVETDVRLVAGAAFPLLVKKIYKHRCRISQVFIVGTAQYKVHFYHIEPKQMQML
mgnify:CR=1 FL=1